MFHFMTSAEYKWTDGSDSDFRNWAPGQPSNPLDELCVEMEIDQISNYPGYWYDNYCDNYNYYICEAPQGRKIFGISQKFSSENVCTRITVCILHTMRVFMDINIVQQRQHNLCKTFLRTFIKNMLFVKCKYNQIHVFRDILTIIVPCCLYLFLCQ